MKLFIKVALISLIPGFLFSPYAIKVVLLFYENEKITDNITNFYTTLFLFIGSLSIFLFNYFSLKRKKEFKVLLNKSDELINLNVQNLLGDLSGILGFKGNIFNIRVFKVKSSNSFGTVIDSTILLENVHIRNITDKIISKKPLTFKYNKKQNIIEGVVGRCYGTKNFYVDFEPKNKNQYTITQEQENLVDNVAFCSALPVIRNNKIEYVISLDSKTNINENTETREELKIAMRAIARLFDFLILK